MRQGLVTTVIGGETILRLYARLFKLTCFRLQERDGETERERRMKKKKRRRKKDSGCHLADKP
jgi:hypothetical protein